MFKMPLIHNQKGAGMYLVMVACAALGVAAMFMGDMFLNAEDVIRKDGRIVSYQLLVDTVRKNLYAGNNCAESLAGDSPLRSSTQRKLIKNALGVVTSGPNEVISITGSTLDFAAQAALAPQNRGIELLGLPVRLERDPIVLESNWKAKTGTGIKSMRLIVEKIVQLPEPLVGRRIIRYPADVMNPLTSYLNLMAVEAYVVIEPDHKGINVWLPENKKYWIKLYAYVVNDAASPRNGQIHSCFDPTSEAVYCTETMKGVFVHDSRLDSGKRCRPDVNCFTYGAGVMPASQSCPAEDYKTTMIGTQFKMCNWCPAIPYPGISTAQVNLPNCSSAAPGTPCLDNFVDYEGVNDDGSGGSDGPDIDCTLPNPYVAMNPRDQWEGYNEFVSIFNSDDYAALPPEQQEQINLCLSKPPPCFTYPWTCANECAGNPNTYPAGVSGPTCSCATGMPDDAQAMPFMVAGDNPSPGPATRCINECYSGGPQRNITNHGIGCNNGAECTPDNPGTCENECTGDTSACPVDDPATPCNEAAGETC